MHNLHRFSFLLVKAGPLQSKQLLTRRMDMPVQFGPGRKSRERDIVIEVSIRFTQLIQPDIARVVNIGILVKEFEVSVYREIVRAPVKYYRSLKYQSNSSGTTIILSAVADISPPRMTDAMGP